MANTKQGIYYPDNYNSVADVPNDMKKMAESIDTEIEKDRTRISKNELAIKNINKKDTAQDTNIATLTQRLNEKDEQIAELEDKVSDLNNNQIHGKASGEYVHLSDSAKMNCEIAVLGNSRQETREGYNLIDFNNPTSLSYYTSKTFEKDTLTISCTGGTWQYARYDIMNIFEKYAGQTMSFQVESYSSSNSEANSTVQLAYNDGKNNYIQLLSSNTFTIPSDISNITKAEIGIYANNTGNALSNTFTVVKPALVLGTEAKPYEKYGAMPSIDYPSEIECVGDNVNVLDFTNYQSFTASNTYLAIKANGFNLKANIDYIFSYSADRDFSTSNALKLWFRDANNSNFKEALANIPFSLTEAELNKLSYIQVVVQGIKAGNSYAGHIYAKIEKGKKATAYSTYGYGNVNVKVCNKNTLVNNLKNQTVNGITVTKNDDGSVLVNGTATATTSFIIAENVKINKQTKLSGCPSSGGFNKFVLQALFDGGSSVDVGLGATIKDEIKYVTIRILIYNGVTVNNEVFYPQIEESPTATDYIAHEEQNYPVDMQEEMLEGDYFDLKNGKEVHNWNETVLNGTENWAIATTLTNTIQYKLDVSGLNITSRNAKSENILVEQTYGDREQLVISKNLKGVFINFSKSRATTLEEFKALLNTNNIKLHYMSEPRKLDLTENQKAQLQALAKAKTYKNITNITTDTIAVLDVDYKKDLETIINNMQAQILAE